MRCHCAGASVSAAAPASAVLPSVCSLPAHARGVKIAAEAAGEVHAAYLFRRDAALLQQHADARRDGGLGQLQIAHVRRCEEHLRRQVKAAVAVVIARQIAAQGCRRVLRWQQPPAGGDDAEVQQHRRQVEQAGAAQPLGFTAADDVIQKAAVVPHTADGTVHARHAARDARALEGRAGRHGAADKPAAPAKGHLAVGADVEKEIFTRQLRQPGGQKSGCDVSADVTRHAGGEAYRHAVQRFASGHCKERLRPEGCRSDAAHGVPSEEVLHDDASITPCREATAKERSKQGLSSGPRASEMRRLRTTT